MSNTATVLPVVDDARLFVVLNRADIGEMVQADTAEGRQRRSTRQSAPHRMTASSENT